MKIVISNGTFGQLYLETTDGQSLRIPSNRVTDFRQAAGLCRRRLTLVGRDAERIWAVAQQYQG